METTIKDLTRAQVISYGSELRRMLKSDAFEAAVNLQREHYRSVFFSSNYADTKAREEAFHKNVALDDLLMSMSAFIDSAEFVDSDDEDEE